jgi:hypothetical protein
MYYIKHLVDTKTGKRLVNFRNVLIDTCKKCRSQSAEFFYGETLIYRETCVYTADKIIEEYRNTPKGFIPKKCPVNGCNKWKY